MDPRARQRAGGNHPGQIPARVQVRDPAGQCVPRREQVDAGNGAVVWAEQIVPWLLENIPERYRISGIAARSNIGRPHISQ